MSSSDTACCFASVATFPTSVFAVSATCLADSTAVPATCFASPFVVPATSLAVLLASSAEPCDGDVESPPPAVDPLRPAMDGWSS